MPPNAEESEGQQIQPNEITYNESRDSFMLVCTETDIVADGTTTTFSKVVLELKADGTWDLVWFEQETK
jgi:hypothetical protein